jgi:hypothetical protein
MSNIVFEKLLSDLENQIVGIREAASADRFNLIDTFCLLKLALNSQSVSQSESNQSNNTTLSESNTNLSTTDISQSINSSTNIIDILTALNILNTKVQDLKDTNITEIKVKTAIESGVNINDLVTKVNTLQTLTGSIKDVIGLNTDLIGLEDSDGSVQSRLRKLTLDIYQIRIKLESIDLHTRKLENKNSYTKPLTYFDSSTTGFKELTGVPGNASIRSLYVNNNINTLFYLQLYISASPPVNGNIPLFNFKVAGNSTVLIGTEYFTNEGINYSTDSNLKVYLARSSNPWNLALLTTANAAINLNYSTHSEIVVEGVL